MKKSSSSIFICFLFIFFSLFFSVDVSAEEYNQCVYQASGVKITITREGDKLSYDFDQPSQIGYNDLKPSDFDNLNPVMEGSCPQLFIKCNEKQFYETSFGYGSNALFFGLPEKIDNLVYGAEYYLCDMSGSDDDWLPEGPLFLDDKPSVDSTYGYPTDESDPSGVLDNIQTTFDCEGETGILGDKEDPDSVAWLIVKFLDYPQILGPSILLLLTGVDYVKIVFFGDDELNKKMNKRLITRLVCLVLLLFVPMLVELLLDIFGLTSCSSIFQ